MRNNSNSPVTEMLNGKYKIQLIAVISAMSAVDFACTVYLFVKGIELKYYLFPLLLMIIDGAYLLGTLFSNQRFKYARKIATAYMCGVIVCIGGWLFVVNMTDKTVFASLSAMLWLCFHAVGLLAVAITYIYAAKRFKGLSAVKFIVASAAAIAVLTGLVVYGAVFAGNGYFGQGNMYRNLVYKYSDDGTCEVVDVLDGAGTDVVIPKEFDGHTVKRVSIDVFFASGVTNVKLDCNSNVTFFDNIIASINETAETDVPEELKISAPRANVDYFRKTLYDLGKTKAEQGVSNISTWFALANKITPYDLSRNEVYLTFSYTPTSYQRALNFGSAGKIIPTFVGTKNSTYTRRSIDINYFEYSDTRNDAHLAWNYKNNGGFILSDLMYDGNSLIGSEISKSGNVDVEFERVFRIYPGNGNDTLYPTQGHFPYSNNLDGCKYTTADNADDILSGFVRNGFSIDWRYKSGNVTSQYYLPYPFTSLKDVFNTNPSGNDFTIFPEWKLVAPTVALKPIDGKTTVVYGDEYSIQSEVSHPLSGVKYSYSWTENYTSKVSTLAVLEFDRMPYYDTKVEYALTVTASAPGITSLTSSVSKSVSVTTSKRPIAIRWTDPTNNVYSASEKIVSASLSNFVPGDKIYLDKNNRLYDIEFGKTDAGTYSFTAFPVGDDANKYTLTSGATHSYTIEKYTVGTTWQNYNGFVYDGNEHKPTVQCTGIGGAVISSEIASITNGSGKVVPSAVDAGTYTAKAISKNNNYKIAVGDDVKSFVISPKSVTANWSSSELEFVYNGLPQYPVPIVKGVNNEGVLVNVSGSGINVGTYTATATSANANYVISTVGNSVSYRIIQKQVDITWGSTSLTYNGANQAPTATAKGVLNVNIPVTVSGGMKNVGNGYSATASISDNNYVIRNNGTTTFTILPKGITVLWTAVSLTYNGAAQKPTATATGVSGENIPVTVSGEKTNAGTYTATAAIFNANYTIATGAATSYTISPKQIAVTWGNTEFTYNGAAQKPTATATGVSGENIPVTVSGEKTNVGTYTATAAIFNANYSLSGNTRTFTIAKRSATITIVSITVEYGETPVYTTTATGFVGSDTVTVTPVATVTKDSRGNITPGTYIISAQKPISDNYEITVVSGTLTVNPEPEPDNGGER